MNNRIKRFYSDVVVCATERGFTVELDRRPVKSPGRHVLILPHQAFADCLAGEWREQGEFIDPALMPMTHFAGRVADSVFPQPADARAEILKYAHSDLLCYRASGPDTLIERQQEMWGPVLDRFKRELGVNLKITSGISYVEQNGEDMERFAALLAPLEGYDLGAVQVITTMSGSALLAIALYKGWLTPEALWQLCHVDEDFQIEQWGSDSEEQQRRQLRYVDFHAATLVFSE